MLDARRGASPGERGDQKVAGAVEGAGAGRVGMERHGEWGWLPTAKISSPTSASRAGLRSSASKASGYAPGSSESGHSAREAQGRAYLSRGGRASRKVTDATEPRRAGSRREGVGWAAAASGSSLEYGTLRRDGFATSDDEIYSLANNLLMRMKQSAIGTEDQLCSAAFMGKHDVVEALIQSGVSVNCFGMVRCLKRTTHHTPSASASTCHCLSRSTRNVRPFFSTFLFFSFSAPRLARI